MHSNFPSGQMGITVMSCLKSCEGGTIKVVKSRDSAVTGAVKIPTENREPFVLPLELMSNACFCKR